MNIYFFSGLGADKRVFAKLQLPATWNIEYVEWIPNLEDEALENYCKRLSAQIDTSQPSSFVGLSFGGIIAIEISKFIKPDKIIIISSVSTKSELPMDWLGKFLLQKCKLFKLIPRSAFNKPNRVLHWLFETKTEDEKKLLDQVIKDTPPDFAKWALGNILNWKNETRPSNLLHIHGSADRIFPIKKTKADIRIEGGGHLMVYSQAEQVSKILARAF
ncbi:MAG TPA: alpha/beta hydrolase [Ferruginibacter sp.]|nr:alpha/beta hydrolase [Ferruginibacter sp.]